MREIRRGKLLLRIVATLFSSTIQVALEKLWFMSVIDNS